MKIAVRHLAVGVALATALGGAFLPAQAQTAPDLLGGWIITDWETREGEPGTPRRGLFVFSETGHYSIMYVVGDAREPLGENPSDAAVAAAARPFRANSGRYSVSGDEITYEAFMAKDPAYMSRFEGTGGEGNAQSMTYRIEDGVLTLEFGEGGPMRGATATLRRPGGG